MTPFPLTILRTTSRRPKYLLLSLAVGFTTLGIAFVLTFLGGWVLASALHIPFDQPIRSVPHGWLWFFLCVVCLLFSTVAGYLGSFLLLVGVLRWVCGWTSTRVRALLFESQMPADWLDAPPA